MKKTAFTLTEILIVIAIVVLLIALAVPAFNLITGGRSIEGATNQLSAMLGRARAQAIGLQKPTGVMFFIDPKTDRRTIALVTQVDGVVTAPSPWPEVWLDIAPDADFLPLPTGVTLQTICDAAFAGNIRQDDGYLGFNQRAVDRMQPPSGPAPQPNPTATKFGGVILFDGSGRLVSMTYGFACGTGTTRLETRMGGLLKPTNANADVVPGPAGLHLRSQFGLVMFERDLAQNYTDTDAKVEGTQYAGETAEETWLDQNSTPILINRYTGTLVKGE